MPIEYVGNRELLNLHKVAFFCSRTVSARAILSCYDWSTQIEIKANVVIGGFQSNIEKDVLHFLLKKKQAIILVIARKMYKKLPEEFIQPMNEGKLLIISTAPKSSRVSKVTAYNRNMYVSQMADEIVFGYISKESSLELLYNIFRNKSYLLCI